MSRLTTTDLGTILGVWAHPDDEAYLTGGLMALARQAGQRVVVATATRGEAGTSDPEAWPPARLARVREAELHASLAALGVTEHHFLDYVDGTLTTRDPVDAIERIADVVTAVRPDTIITFGPDGLTGHPDHCRVSSWTTAARELAAPSARLLYATTSAPFAARWQRLHNRFDIYLDPDLPTRTPVDQIALEVTFDADLAERKLVALTAQSSQTAALIAAMGEQVYRAWISTETFRTAGRVVPQRSHAQEAAVRRRQSARPRSAARAAAS